MQQSYVLENAKLRRYLIVNELVRFKASAQLVKKMRIVISKIKSNNIIELVLEISKMV